MGASGRQLLEQWAESKIWKSVSPVLSTIMVMLLTWILLTILSVKEQQSLTNLRLENLERPQAATEGRVSVLERTVDVMNANLSKLPPAWLIDQVKRLEGRVDILDTRVNDLKKP